METFQQHTVSFGCPVRTPCLIPVLHASTPSCVNEPFMVDGQAFHVTCFSLQNPYGVVITESVDALDISFPGSKLSAHPLFPNGADIVFVEIENKDLIKARLYKKEEGEVGFSKRGACAAFVAARILQKTHKASAVVEMGGKMCSVEWDGVDGDVKFTGISTEADYE